MLTKEEEPHKEAPTEAGFVWVYQYTFWDEASGARKTSQRFATLEVIHCGLGEFIPTSGKKIPIANLIDGKFAE